MNVPVKETTHMGFTYTVEHLRNGELIDTFQVSNLVPDEGLNHALGVLLKAETQQTTWYVGLFEGNYTPTNTITAATVTSVATECTAYDETTRVEWIGGAISGGAVSNTASTAAFTINATKAIYGGFMVSSSAKSSTVGILVSIVRFPTVKNVEATDILRVTASFTNISAA